MDSSGLRSGWSPASISGALIDSPDLPLMSPTIRVRFRLTSGRGAGGLMLPCHIVTANKDAGRHADK